MWKLIVIGLLSGIGSGYNNNVMGPALVRIHANQHFDHANDGVITVGYVKTPLTCNHVTLRSATLQNATHHLNAYAHDRPRCGSAVALAASRVAWLRSSSDGERQPCSGRRSSCSLGVSSSPYLTSG